ncbi:hypothetical protein LCGC14_2651770 [marine sediment metagenome]|uniref:Uncharacterized protein n=1 Tax=marine sediment metagenome TaxID=412755 RepID=A0A0F8ZUN2_9ZZZZ
MPIESVASLPKRDVRGGPALRQVDYLTEYIHRFEMGQVATDGVQYSALATVGTTAVEILNEVIDSGINIGLKTLEFGLTQKFTNRVAAFAGSMSYYWEVMQENVGTANWLPLTGTIAKGIGSGVGSLSEDTFSGFVTVGSLVSAPLRVRLTALGIRDANFTGEVKNSSFVRLIGATIPGV